jgi:uncharacterized Zn finger protein
MNPNLHDPAVARKYITDFKHILGREASYIETSSGRRIDFATMDDVDAVWVANQLRSMELAAARRGAYRRRYSS